MKKIFSFILLVFIASTSFAQGKMYFNDVKGNRFGDNWELTFGTGLNYSVYDGVAGNNFSDAIGYGAELSATKWFNPIIGARLQVISGALNVDDFGPDAHITPHMDAVVNLSNWIGGYREDRVYYAKLFAGAGLHIVDVASDAGYGMTGAFGLINTFRVSEDVDLNLELRSLVMKGDDMQSAIANRAGKVGQIYSATIGVSVRFNKKDFVHAVPSAVASDYLTQIEMLQKDLSNSKKAINALIKDRAKLQADKKSLMADNLNLHNQIKNHKCDVNIVNASFVFFDVNSYKISDYGCVALNELARNIKKSNDKFTIVGHADKATGTNEYNLKLSEKRAKAVYDYLIEQGVNKDQLSYVGHGGTDVFHSSPKANRLAIIK